MGPEKVDFLFFGESMERAGWKGRVEAEWVG
jgi:hypothetical protein